MSHNADYEINKELGECYLFMGEYEKAREYYQKAANAGAQSAEPFMGLAAISLAEGDLESALTLYAKAHKVAPSDKTLSGMGMVEAELGKHEDAFGHFNEALKLNVANMIAMNSMLQLSHFLGRLEEMVPHLEAAVAGDVGDTEALRFALSACLLQTGNEEKAKEHLETLLGDNPANSEAQQLYARFAA